MTAITESTRPANTLVTFFDSIVTSLRHGRGRKRFRNFDHLNDRLLADIGLTRARLNGFPEPWSQGVVRPAITDRS